MTILVGVWVYYFKLNWFVEFKSKSTGYSLTQLWDSTSNYRSLDYEICKDSIHFKWTSHTKQKKPCFHAPRKLGDLNNVAGYYASLLYEINFEKKRIHYTEKLKPNVDKRIVTLILKDKLINQMYLGYRFLKLWRSCETFTEQENKASTTDLKNK